MWPFRGEAATVQVLSVLSPEDASAGGLPNEAIAGTIATSIEATEAAGFSQEDFTPNPAFANFMHQVIAHFGPLDLELQAEAKRQGAGQLCIVDMRTVDWNNVPIHDLIGGFFVVDGQLGEYHPNPDHLLCSERGLVQLPPSLAARHINELKRLSGGS